MVEFMNNNPDAGIIAPKLLYGDGSIQPSISSFPNPWHIFLRMYGLKKLMPKWAFSKRLPISLGKVITTYLSPYTDSKTTREVDFVSGACMFFRRDLINQIGLLDENFFMYVEDADWCKRIKGGGWKIYYYPTAKVTHFVGKSSGGTFHETNPEAYKNILYYFKKHHERNKVIIVKMIITSSLVLKIIGLLSLSVFMKAKRRSKRSEIKKTVNAYWDITKYIFKSK